ncbi:MAG: type II toxin-antitoxin system Phd/YefM family antitoxin [Spirochaetales bacterium]|nr:type II toxin-antitoxin system Phd/YefM family antitoxin [Spirochaetales bacterium]
MDLKEDIKSISYIKSHTADILNQVNDTHRPIIITQNGEARAVLLDTDSYESLQRAVGLLKILNQSEKDILNGELIDQKNVLEELDKKYLNLK